MTTVDAPVVTTVDAPVVTTVDAPVVTTADANVSGVDAGAFSASAVWIAGDFITNNSQQLGHFSFPVASPPIVPSVYPTASTNIDLLNFSSPYSVSKDGSKIVYAQNVTSGDQLFLGGVDGTSPTLVFTATGANITDAALSPDGSHIAFRSDMVLAGMFDDYVIGTAGGTPTKMSPNRAANSTDLDASGALTWSDDSRYVAYSVQFVAKGRFELHVFDTMNSVDHVIIGDGDITAAGTSTVGALGAAQFDTADNVYYVGFFDGTNQRLYSSLPDGSMQPTTFMQAVATNNLGPAKVSSFALSPNRKTIAFVEDVKTQTAFEMFTVDISTAHAAAVQQTTGHTAGQSIDQIDQSNWNHAGNSVAFHADFGATANKFQPYVLNVSTSSLTRIATVGLDTDATRNSQNNVAWSTDDMTVFIISDGGTPTTRLASRHRMPAPPTVRSRSC